VVAHLAEALALSTSHTVAIGVRGTRSKAPAVETGAMDIARDATQAVTDLAMGGAAAVTRNQVRGACTGGVGTLNLNAAAQRLVKLLSGRTGSVDTAVLQLAVELAAGGFVAAATVIAEVAAVVA
jgi:hypothetical protein